jgi:competence protein ComEC
VADRRAKGRETAYWLRLAPHMVLGAFCLGLAASLVLAPPRLFGVLTCLGAGAAAAACTMGRRPAAAMVLLCAAALTAGNVWGAARIVRTAPPELDLPTVVRGSVVLDTPLVPSAHGGWRGRALVERLEARDGPPVPRGTRLLLDLRDTDDPPPVGTRLRVEGPLAPAFGPRSPSWWRAWLSRQGLAARLRPQTVRADGRRGGVRGLRDRWRQWAGAHAGAGLSGDRGAIVRGMALGGGAGLSEETAEAFRDAGLWHLLAVSGQNVAVVAVATMALLGALGTGRRASAGAAAVVMALYCLACDGGASVARAGIVGTLALLAEVRSSNRERWYLMLVGLAVLLAQQPRALGDPGLQLSFAAVAGLFCLAPPLAAWFGGWLPGRIADLAGLAAAASLATAPVVVWHFGRLSLVGLALNVVAVPVAAPIVILALAGLGVGAVFPAAGVAIAWMAGLGAGMLLLAARVGSAIPGAAVDLPAMVAPVLLVGVLGLLALARLARPGAAPERLRGPPWRALTVLGGALVLGAWSLGVPGRPPPWPSVASLSVLDIGQGDAILLRSPEGRAALVDTGPPGAPAPVVAALRRTGVRRVDTLVMTHDSLDHVGGVIDILGRFPVGVVLHPPEPVDGWQPAAQAAIAAARARGVSVREIRAGSGIDLGLWRLRVLSPVGRRPAGADPNPYSLVARASAGSLDVLLTADAESDALSRLVTGSVDVLKVSHHGSEDPGLPRQLSSLRPRVALISAGEHNQFRHPRPETLAALAAQGASVLRTDLSGDLSVSVVGGSLVVSGTR